MNPYDVTPYPCWPRLETHPDRLAAAAILHGLRPAPVPRCRVLEIGCGDGGNLLPMAYTLPHAACTGIELAREPARTARRTVEALGLRNVRILQTDLRRARGLGEVDYIVVHGLYSWIPAEVRDALLALCRRHLAPHGVAMISYNVYPGRHIRQMLREMMLFHTGGQALAGEARDFLVALRDRALLTPAWRGLLEEEIGEMLGREAASLVHDDLAPVSQPVYFHEFAAHAARHRLRYLADAHLHEATGAAIGHDRIEREQYLDLLKLRRFRQSLLCREDAPVADAPLPARLARLWFSSPAQVEGDCLMGANRVRVRRGNRILDRMARRLAEAWPRPVPYRDLASDASEREVLYSLVAGGFVEPHAWRFPAPVTPGSHPRLSRFARLQLDGARMVTNLLHRTVELDESMAALALLADGSRDHATLARQWGSPLRRTGQALAWLARMALLEA